MGRCPSDILDATVVNCIDGTRSLCVPTGLRSIGIFKAQSSRRLPLGGRVTACVFSSVSLHLRAVGEYTRIFACIRISHSLDRFSGLRRAHSAFGICQCGCEGGMICSLRIHQDRCLPRLVPIWLEQIYFSGFVEAAAGRHEQLTLLDCLVQVPVNSLL